MSVESPISTALIGRTPDPTLQTAGFLVMMMLSLWVESPVIDLLSTGTTWSTSRDNAREIQRFALGMMFWATAAHALIALTPVYGWLTISVLRMPPELAEVVRIPLILMLPWSPCIGWRRWRQGVMIRAGETKAIGIGTFLRLISIVGVGLILLAATPLPGIQVAACALSASVFVEAVYVHYASRAVMEEMQPKPGVPTVTQAQLLRFHMPLTLATMVMMTATPLVGVYLAKVANPVEQMAAWQVAASIAWVFRTMTFAIPEVVIALADEEQHRDELRRFCVGLGALLSALLLVFTLGGMLAAFMASFQRVRPEVVEIAQRALIYCSPMPAINGFLSYFRGRLTHAKKTGPRLVSIALAILALLLFMQIGLALKWEGVFIAAVALVASQVVETLVQGIWWIRTKRELEFLRAHPSENPA